MMRWIQEVCLMTGQSLRMLWKGKQTILLFVISLLILTFLLVSMDEVKEEKSKIAIGIVNEDGSEFSSEVIESMRQKDLYDIFTGEENALIERLKAGELSAVCVLKETFTENVVKGKTDNLITIYETEEKSALLLGDIFAGVMMQEICTEKSYQTLLKYMKKTGKGKAVPLEEYREYVNYVLAEGGTEFSFDITYVSGTGPATEKPAQTILYEQAIFAVFALMSGLIATYAVLPFRQIKHGRLADRIKTLPVHESALYIGSALAGLLLPVLFGIVVLVCFSLRNNVDILQFLSLLVCTVTYLCVIVSMMLLAAYGIKNQLVYQMGMLAMILVFGIFGLVSLVDGLLVPEGTLVWAPNGWYVRRMTELYHQY